MEVAPFRSSRHSANHSQLSKRMRVMAFLLAFSVTLAAAAQDESPTAPQSPLDGMTSDLEKLDLLKRGLAPGESNGAGITVQFTTPTLQDETGTPSIALPSETLSTKAQQEETWRQENWLLAGMQENNQPASSEGVLEENEDLEPQSGSADHWLLLAADAAGENTRFEEAEATAMAGEIADKVVNPLEGFMTDWLDASLATTEFSSDLEDSGLGALGTIADRDFGTESFDLSKPAGVSTPGFDLTGSLGSDRTNPYTERFDELPALSGLSADSLNINPPIERSRAMNDVAPTIVPSATTGPNNTVTPTREAWRPPEKDQDKYFSRLNQF